MKMVSIAIVALASSARAAVAGDIAAGEKTFKKCMPCHSIGETAKNSIGPIQNGLKGRKSGSVPGYNYSDANKNSGIVWDEGTFKEYIKDPNQGDVVVPLIRQLVLRECPLQIGPFDPHKTCTSPPLPRQVECAIVAST